MSSLLFEGGVVVPVDLGRTVLDPGYVLGVDGRIRGVGEGTPDPTADRIYHVSRCVVGGDGLRPPAPGAGRIASSMTTRAANNRLQRLLYGGENR